MSKADSSTNPKHAHKIATDAHGGDPLNPNEPMQLRIAEVVDGGKKDAMVTRWAHAFQTVCPEPVQLTPTVPMETYMKALPEVRPHLASPFLDRVLLAKVADAVEGKKSDEATEWAKSVKSLVK
jgi:hypothetical protein